MWRRPKLAAVVGTTLVLLLPAAAQGAVTIGSNLGRAPGGVTDSYGCAPSCTLAQVTLATDRQAAGGLVSPVNGTVVLWRIRAANGSTPTALRVVKHLAGGLWTGAGRSTTVTPANNALSSFPTQLPIAIGDSIGIDCCSPSAQYFLSSGGTINAWNPSLAEGGPGVASAGPGDQHEIMLNADIEPTSAFTVTRRKAKKGGAIGLTVQLPNAGTLVAGDPHDYSLGAAGGKRLMLKHDGAQAGPGTVNLTVPTTKTARAVLAERGRLRLRVKIVFTPTGGSASSQTLKVKLRR